MSLHSLSRGVSAARCLIIVALLILSAVCAAADLPRVEYKGRIPDSKGKVSNAPRTLYLSLWRGGSLEIGSGEKIYSEVVTAKPDNDGILAVWLGRGKVLFGKLDAADLRTGETIYMQESVDKETNVLSRIPVSPMDNVWVARNPGWRKYWHSKDVYDGLLLKSKMPKTDRRGLAILYPDGKMQKEDGSIVSFAKSKTAGIQELFDYCAKALVDGYIVGGSSPSGGAVVYDIYAPIRLRPSQGFRFDTGAVTLRFNTEIGSDTCLTIDSCMMVDFAIRGQIVNLGKGYALAFNPENHLRLDTFVGPTIVDSSFHITTLATRGHAVLFKNSINYNTFFFNEINGGGIGVHTLSGGFSNNKFTCKHIHNQSRTAVLVQTGACNVWEVNINPDAREPVGIDTAGADDVWFVNVHAKNKPGIVLQPDARGNQFHVMGLAGGFENKARNPTNRFYMSPSSPAEITGLGFAADTPPIPAPGAPAINRNPYPVIAMVLTAGSVSGWTLTDVYGTSQSIDGPLTLGQNIYLAPGESIILKYADGGAPTWRWRAVN